LAWRQRQTIRRRTPASSLAAVASLAAISHTKTGSSTAASVSLRRCSCFGVLLIEEPR
jgi:hypothetical protein